MVPVVCEVAAVVILAQPQPVLPHAADIFNRTADIIGFLNVRQQVWSAFSEDATEFCGTTVVSLLG